MNNKMSKIIIVVIIFIIISIIIYLVFINKNIFKDSSINSNNIFPKQECPKQECPKQECLCDYADRPEDHDDSPEDHDDNPVDDHDNPDDSYSLDKNCDELFTKRISCKTHIAPIGNCNQVLKDFFKNNNVPFSMSYLGDIQGKAVEPALLIATYDKNNKQLSSGIPYRMFQKIIREKLTNSNNKTQISVFIAQVAINTTIKTRFGEINPFEIGELYHTQVLFVETSRYKKDYKAPTQILPETILFALQLWGGGSESPFSIGSCVYPVIKNGAVDLSMQATNVICIEYPEAYGCNSDGLYWKNYHNKIWYMGDTRVEIVDKLYNTSINWLSKKWGYSIGCLTSDPGCSSDIKTQNMTPKDALLGNTCVSYGQGMCLALETIDPQNFNNTMEKVPWGQMEIVCDWEKVDLSNNNNNKILDEYCTFIYNIINSKTKKLYAIPGQKDYDDSNQNFYSKYLMNLLLGFYVVKMITFTLKLMNKNIYFLVFDDNEKQYNVYKCYNIRKIQSVNSVCSGLLYKKYNPYNSFPTIDYRK
jgi:hypothetical protein